MRDPYGIVGQTIDRRYAVKRVVAEGGFGVVYEAEAVSLGVPVALKVLRLEMQDAGPDVRARFAQEAKLLARLKHPAIVELTDAAHLEDGTPYLVLAWIEGETLDARIRRVGPMELEPVIRLLTPVVGAIAYAHAQGVVHRDLKPANLMFSGDDRARVLDFGVARWANSLAVQTTTTSKTGISLGYAAPEQYGKEFGPIDGRADQFALAAIVYAVLTAQPAFSGDSMTEILFATCAAKERPSIRKVRPELPESVDVILQRALAIRPQDRYASVEEFWSELSAAVTGAPLTLPKPQSNVVIASKIPAAVTLPSPQVLGEGAPKTIAEVAFAQTERDGEPPQRPSGKSRASAAPGAPARGFVSAHTVRQGEAPPTSEPVSRRSGGTRFIVFLAILGILGGGAYAASALGFFAPSPNGSVGTGSATTKPTVTYKPSAPSASDAGPVLPPCGLEMLAGELCVLGGRLHRGPYDCKSAGAQLDHKSACPDEIVLVRTFTLDKKEVSGERWKKCEAAGKCPALAAIAADAPDLPVRGMSFADAAAFCAFEQKRLPTDAEWELAAAGAGDTHRLFPWGNATPSDALAVFSTTGEDGHTLAGPSPVGTHVPGATPDGLLDLAGNVSEWTSTPAPKGAPTAAGPEPTEAERRIWVRGGSYLSGWDALRTWSREAWPESTTGGAIGLRCARTIKSIKN